MSIKYISKFVAVKHQLGDKTFIKLVEYVPEQPSVLNFKEFITYHYPEALWDDHEQAFWSFDFEGALIVDAFVVESLSDLRGKQQG